MKQISNQYVGRIVRLKENVFQEIKAMHKGAGLENGFLVTEVNRNLQSLTCCYGADFRIVVDASDAELVESSPSPFYPLSLGPVSQQAAP